MFKESLECLLSLLVFEILGIQRTQYNLNSHVTKYNLHLKGIINVCMCISFDNTAVLILRQMLKCWQTESCTSLIHQLRLLMQFRQNM